MNHLEHIESKIWHMDKELGWQLAVWRFHGQKFVFTNGCFDLLHLGHIDYLAKAASEGTLLIVGLNSDASVRRIKGDSRPVTDEKSRAMSLAALGVVGADIVRKKGGEVLTVDLVEGYSTTGIIEKIKSQ